MWVNLCIHDVSREKDIWAICLLAKCLFPLIVQMKIMLETHNHIALLTEMVWLTDLILFELHVCCLYKGFLCAYMSMQGVKHLYIHVDVIITQ